MLPPVLEIYIVWHPSDRAGENIGEEIIRHFRGSAFTGLIGGAVEVLVRSQGWAGGADAPRPIPTSSRPQPNGIPCARYTAIVPLCGTELAASVEAGSPWRGYAEAIVEAQREHPATVGIFPYLLAGGALSGTVLGGLFGAYQAFAAGATDAPHDTAQNLRCRDLTQSLAQFLSPEQNPRVTAFISHTKYSAAAEVGDVKELVALVREVIANTHLAAFFDASDLQPGTDWSAELVANAATSALLALRTDLYPSRVWCQREMLTAKRNGMPVIIVDGIGYAEERGSFLMDHVPRAPIHVDDGRWRRRDVYRALDLLVDECLKRELWRCQRELAGPRDDLKVSWWAPHAPEPLTLIQWLEEARAGGSLPAGTEPLRIIHPDPPLGTDEAVVLQQIARFGGVTGNLDVMTPRQLAGRGG
ncbi:MAG: toll/interleukin-1 receptor domain-containing protein [Mesorhizobium sp.]|uniref:hypothetical protein n=1 Tax=Mesorhizobium sp. SP-1A TaxID=3077840 RepID=UPI001AC2AD8E|nr:MULTISPECIES: hypothetical protein [unclassified Mesorhizobium]MBN9245739.1 toll/interleukin-1 receptor domain-containing protein [Mesorhizobium sp.]